MARRKAIKNNGFLLLDKPEGISSHFAANTVGKIIGGRRGIEGILDPFATGLLIIAFGESTRFLQQMDGLYKVYEAVIKLGTETDTLDHTGTVTAEKSVPELEKNSLHDIGLQFLGNHEQLPPAFSNLKIKGKRAHEIAREGKIPDLKPRLTYVDQIRLKQLAPDEIHVQVTAARGCYIRSLGRDIALKLGTVGHLKTLRRIAIGPWRSLDAVSPESATVEDLKETGKFLEWIHEVKLDAKQMLTIVHGQRLDFHKPDGTYKLCFNGKFFGIGQIKDNILKGHKLIPISEEIISSLQEYPNNQ